MRILMLYTPDVHKYIHTHTYIQHKYKTAYNTHIHTYIHTSVVTIPDFAMRFGYVSRYLGHDAIRIAILVYRVSQSLDLQFVYDGSAIYRPKYTLPNHHNRCRMCWSLAVA